MKLVYPWKILYIYHAKHNADDLRFLAGTSFESL